MYFRSVDNNLDWLDESYWINTLENPNFDWLAKSRFEISLHRMIYRFCDTNKTMLVRPNKLAKVHDWFGNSQIENEKGFSF